MTRIFYLPPGLDKCEKAETMKSLYKIFSVFAILLIKANLLISQDFGKNYNIIEFSYCYDSVEFSSTNPNYNIWNKLPQDSLKNVGDSKGIHLSLPNFKSCHGYGRIKLKFYADSLAVSKLWQLDLRRSPYEVYLNGKLIFSTGIISTDINKEEIFNFKTALPFEFIINNAGINNLEIKFSNLKIFKKNGKDYFRVYNIKISPKKEDLMIEKIDLLKNSIETSFYSMFFFSLFVIFFVIFLMYRKFLNYLYFSLFNLFISVLIFTVSSMDYFIPHNSFSDLLIGISMIMIICFILFLPVNMFFSENKKLKKVIYFLIIFLALYWIISDILPYTSRLWTDSGLFIIIALSIIFANIISILAIRKKKSGAKIIGIGLLFPFFSIILFTIIEILLSYIFHINIGNTFINVIAISPLSIPLSMATYLAREMTLNNKSLEKQIIEIQRLSEENIVKEREKQKIVEEQNIVLEKQVKERTAEIEHQKEEIESQRDLVTIQKEKIEEIHKEVTDSINYAKRIQTSTLPNIRLLGDFFSDLFILFKPKDVVSGDFYWFAKVENQIVVTVADCTGHGVPGAFMSMLGMSLLKEIVINEYITQPDIILKRLRKGVIKALGQTGTSGEQKDGMDISLCSINLETLEMQWAGANNPCLIIKDGKMIELKADKMPIAIFDIMDKFNLQYVKLQKNDIIYIASDGYADQFGGPDNKKFMSTRFKEFLLTISNKSMVEQKDLLDKTVEDWKNNYEIKNDQTDDITVLAIKI
jgi:serine phosphatase RsbU (regulator of sigma subunit)